MSWGDLFERADECDVTLDEVRIELARRRQSDESDGSAYSDQTDGVDES